MIVIYSKFCFRFAGCGDIVGYDENLCSEKDSILQGSELLSCCAKHAYMQLKSDGF